MIHFRHLQRRKYFAIADLLCVGLAAYLAFFVRTNIHIPLFVGLLPNNLPQGFSSLWLPACVTGLVFILIQYAFGIYDLWHTSNATNWLQRLFPANLALVTFAFTYLYLSKNYTFPRSLLIVVFFVNYFLSVSWRVLYFQLTKTDISNVVLVGKWEEIEKLLIELAAPPFSTHTRVSAVFTPDYCDNIPPECGNRYLILPPEEFENYTDSNPCASVILASSDSFRQKAFSFVLSAANRGISVYAMPTIYEVLLGRLQHLRINDLPLIELRLNPQDTFAIFTKRLFDIIVSAVALALLAIPMLIVGTFIKLTSPGPIIYKQIRVGYLGREFVIYKFRSMTLDAERETGAVLATKSDKRLTLFGKFMRETRIDELPQLWNILKGEMSFVGPRPERPIFVQEYEATIDGYSKRHRVKPGVTGLAQVSGSYITSAEIKLKYDLAYISNQNVIFDAQIICRTLKTVFTKAGV